jgi:hypothetical protein
MCGVTDVPVRLELLVALEQVSYQVTSVSSFPQ